MSATVNPSVSDGVSRDNPDRSNESPRARFWEGWVAFSAVVLFMVGSFQIVEGTIALLHDDYFAVTRSGLPVSVDYTVWGWLHLVAGALFLVTSVGVFGGRGWARAIAVVIACVMVVVNFGFSAADPMWSSLMITVNILVIWALIVHGGEIRVPEESQTVKLGATT
jgi:hypothetical protein